MVSLMIMVEVGYSGYMMLIEFNDADYAYILKEILIEKYILFKGEKGLIVEGVPLRKLFFPGLYLLKFRTH